MKFNHLILGSAVAMTAFGLMACSDDSSSNASSEPASSASIYVPPTATAESPINFNSLKVSTSQLNGELYGMLSGIIELNIDFVDGTTPYTASATTQIDGVTFTVGKTENGQIVQQDIVLDVGTTFPAERVSLSQKTFAYSQLSGCGEFQLYVVANASMSEEGLKTTNYTSVDTLTFTRPESDCAEPVIESSSEAAAPCTELTEVTMTLSNSLGTDQYALNMETGLADNPDFTLSFKNSEVFIVPSAGVSVMEENSMNAGELPTAPVCLEKFNASNYDATEDAIRQNLWVVVTTAAGKQYPMMIGKIMSESSTKGSVVITYYK